MGHHGDLYEDMGLISGYDQEYSQKQRFENGINIRSNGLLSGQISQCGAKVRNLVTVRQKWREIKGIMKNQTVSPLQLLQKATFDITSELGTKFTQYHVT